MAEWHDIADEAAIVEGKPHPFVVDGKPIALYRLDGQIHAICDFCSHEPNVLLSEGFLDGDAIECPMHQSCFDIRTGEALGPPAEEDIPVYPVKVENNRVFVQI